METGSHKDGARQRKYKRLLSMQLSRASTLCVASTPYSTQSPKSRIFSRVLFKRLYSRIRKLFRHKRTGLGPMTLSEYAMQFGKMDTDIDVTEIDTLNWITMVSMQTRATCGLENHYDGCRCPGDGNDLLLALQEGCFLGLDKSVPAPKSIPLFLTSEEIYLEQLFQEIFYDYEAKESELLEDEPEMRSNRIDSILAPQGLNVNMSDAEQKPKVVTAAELDNDDIMLALVFSVL